MVKVLILFFGLVLFFRLLCMIAVLPQSREDSRRYLTTGGCKAQPRQLYFTTKIHIFTIYNVNLSFNKI